MSRCTECGHLVPMTRSIVCSVTCFAIRRKRRLKDQRDDERLKEAIAYVTRRELPQLPQLTTPRLPAGSFYGGWKECKK